MTLHAQPADSKSAAVRPPVSAAAEAARYALLRRLAPSMRHHLVVNLQPIGMIYEVLDRRLQAVQPNMAEVHEAAHKINKCARAALNSCLDVITWLAPADEAAVSAMEGARECLELVASSFAFRGFPIRNDVEPVPGRIRHAAVRNVLTGALLYLSDAHAAPAQIALSSGCVPTGLRLTLTVTPSAGEPGFAAGPTYRPLDWGDMEALAAAEEVDLQRVGHGLHLTFPCVPTAAA